MNAPVQQHSGLLAARESAAPFALPRSGLAKERLGHRLAGKLSRFAARHTRTKTLVLGGRTPMATFTFDDVPASACALGTAILEQYGARGTFFVAAGGCGSPSPGGRLAAADQLGALVAHGHEIGCHTYSHPAVSALSTTELAADLDRNQEFLQRIGGATAGRNFAYPYGDLSFRTKRYLETRFDSCRSLLRGLNEGAADLGALKTCPLEDATIDRADVHDFVARTVRANAWLIFSCHDVASSPSRFGVTPDLLAFAVRTARDAGCRLTTIAGGLALAQGGALGRNGSMR